jgi:hypothetical protein
LQRREEFDENSRRECEQEILSHHEDDMFWIKRRRSYCIIWAFSNT